MVWSQMADLLISMLAWELAGLDFFKASMVDLITKGKRGGD